jgi:serine/threonine-protein kinase RsbW
VNARHPEVVWLDLPARYTYLHLLSDCIADLLQLVEGNTEAELVPANIQLAAHEACTNIVGHAYGNTGAGRINIKVALEFDPTRMTIELQDEGRPFDSAKYTAPNLDEVQIHGYGLFLIHSLMDEVTYTPLPGRNRWYLVKNLFAEGI